MTSFNLSMVLSLLSMLGFLGLTCTHAADPVSLYHFSENATFSQNSLYNSSLDSLISYLSSNVTRNIEFYNTTSDPVYGLFLCYGDVTSQMCRACVAAATKELAAKCSREKVAVIWISVNRRRRQKRSKNRQRKKQNLSSNNSRHCCPKAAMMLLVLSYSFLTRRSARMKLNEEKGSSFEKPDHILTYNAANEIAKEIATADCLQFDFGTIEAATNKFSNDKKLGSGGFGEVYKATLPTGQEIAVKRLWRSSGQGVDRFKNEVVLAAKLQHKNLTALLGFCLEGEEKILIYEFLPNKGLDYFLYDPERQGQLDWSRRYKIIVGIARGILYLHEDSRLRIIHRDLKASNILLDGDMNPKISDFGMAKIFGVDQTQGKTRRIAGTFGYMSPEYAMQCKLIHCNVN
ncbi:hypothetical protein F2P56_006578 [Juglans regia]|uniref:Cysteine-rich receptor-like protein kinase 10 n=1 Tax=Juglans regia TaxID=51240 RepID=A0A833Y003_JUGRE|nr:hypothetical protein F2P56_006578 [Juglans regia]